MTVKVPKVTFNIVPSAEKEKNEAQKILFVGQKLASGTATQLTIIKDIPYDKSWDTLFGAGSILAGMIRSAKEINVETRMDAVALDDNGASIVATSDITIVGTTSAETTLTLYVGSDTNHKYTISVASLSSETVVAAAFETAINADVNRIVDPSAAAGVLTLTALNKGLEGNFIGLRLEGDLGGLTSITVPAMAGGTLAPDVSTLPTLIGKERYNRIVMPSTYDYSAIATWLDGRFNTENDIRDGVLIIGITDSVSNGKTLGDSKDNKSMAVHFNKLVSITDEWEGSALFELDYVLTSRIAAISSLRLTDDSNISRYTISTYGSKDAFGGMHMASKPYHNTPFFNLNPIESGFRFELTDEEQEELNESGLFFLGNNRARTTVIAGDVVTTYKTNPISGQPDGSFKYLNYVDTYSAIREYFVDNSRQRFAQSRLTPGDLIKDIDMANENTIRAYMTELYSDLNDYALTVGGPQAIRFFKDKHNLKVTLNYETGKATVNMVVPIVTQLREIEGVIRVSFTINFQQQAA